MDTDLAFQLGDIVTPTETDSPFYGRNGSVVDLVGVMDQPVRYAVLFDVPLELLGEVDTIQDGQRKTILSWGFRKRISLYSESEISLVAS